MLFLTNINRNYTTMMNHDEPLSTMINHCPQFSILCIPPGNDESICAPIGDEAMERAGRAAVRGQMVRPLNIPRTKNVGLLGEAAWVVGIQLSWFNPETSVERPQIMKVGHFTQRQTNGAPGST